MAVVLRGVFLPSDTVEERVLDDGSAETTVVSGGFILPGLVDAHCHIGIAPGGAPVSSLDEARSLAFVDRDAGVLAIRDAGSPFAYPSLDDDVEMPRLARAGQHVAPIRRYLPHIGVEVPPAQVAEEITRQAALGNGWVKLVGDWIDRSIGDLAPAFPPSVLREAVAAAHAAGVRITAHCFEEESVAVLVDAGIDCVEHGTGLAPDVIDEMARRGIALVPTMLNVSTFGDIATRAAEKFPLYSKHMLALLSGFPAVVRAAYEAGVPIYVGSDAGGGINHGLAAREMLRLHEAGMSTTDVLAAGSWGARSWLGFDGSSYDGDYTVYDSDPRLDLSVLLRPGRVILRRRIVR